MAEFFFPGELLDATLNKVGVSLLNFSGEATGNLSVPLQALLSALLQSTLQYHTGSPAIPNLAQTHPQPRDERKTIPAGITATATEKVCCCPTMRYPSAFYPTGE
ncbi:hypothetical protein DPMN_034152 [Dreissena polymorpha]|uniref:Uncharacterized protein n=1 Tax=Dreissena polymorpha TaxID=45954 RepID=A0A9D4RKM3_DREPO|nr:hypothetical protein DPMN_034152 [Dreissena polymorpha]